MARVALRGTDDRISPERLGSTGIAGWGTPVRLPDTVNVTSSAWKLSIAAEGKLFFTNIGKDGSKRLFSSKYRNGTYETAQPFSFSDGKHLDEDPEVALDGSFLIFCSAGRLEEDTKDHLFIVRRAGDGWGKVEQIRCLGDQQKPDGFSNDDEPHLGGPDQADALFQQRSRDPGSSSAHA